MNIKNHKKIIFINFILLSLIINIGAISSLYSQSVTGKTPFNFGEVVLYNPGVGSVTLSESSRTATGNAVLIPSHPGTLLLASFTYSAKGRTTVTSVTIDQINVGTGTNITVNNFVISPPLPITLNNNQTQLFIVTQARINFNGVISPGIYSSTTPYTVRVNGKAF